MRLTYPWVSARKTYLQCVSNGLSSVNLSISYLLVYFWCSGTGECLWTRKGTDKSSWTQQGLNSVTPDWGNIASCQLSSTYVSLHWFTESKTQSQWHGRGGTGQLTTCLNAQVSISTPVSVNFELRPAIFSPISWPHHAHNHIQLLMLTTNPILSQTCLIQNAYKFLLLGV